MTFKIGDRVKHWDGREGTLVLNGLSEDGLIDEDGDLRIKFDDTLYEVWHKPDELVVISSEEGTRIDRKDIKVGDRIRAELFYGNGDKAAWETVVAKVYGDGAIESANFYFGYGGSYTFTLFNRAEPDPKIEAAVQALVALGQSEENARDIIKENT